MYSQCGPFYHKLPKNHWLCGWIHYEHIAGYFMKGTSMSGSGTCWAHFAQNCEGNQWSIQNMPSVHLAGHIEIKVVGTLWATFWKEPLGCFTQYPLDTLLSTLWNNSTRTCQLHAGWIAVNHNVISMETPGKWGLPLVWWSGLVMPNSTFTMY